MVWRSAPADSERFVAAVAGAGAAALAAGDAVFGGIPDDVVEACRRHDLPLLAVPEQTSFSDVTELVVGALSAARGDRLALTLSRQRELLTAVAGGLGLDEVTARIAASTGRACRVLTATGRAVAASAPVPEQVLDRVVGAFLTAVRLPAVTRAEGTVLSVFPVGPGVRAAHDLVVRRRRRRVRRTGTRRPPTPSAGWSRSRRSTGPGAARACGWPATSPTTPSS